MNKLIQLALITTLAGVILFGIALLILRAYQVINTLETIGLMVVTTFTLLFSSSYVINNLKKQNGKEEK